MDESILGSVKKICGLTDEIHSFDHELVLLINSVLGEARQLGVGQANFNVQDETQVWSDVVTDVDIQLLKQFVFLRVKFEFDPPATGFGTAAMERQINKAEWRLNNAREAIVQAALEAAQEAV